MGREIRRVPLDFDWPVGRDWPGCLTVEDCGIETCPDSESCPDGVPRERGRLCALHSVWWDHPRLVEPPAGDGWQVWQTVGGGPISPVFPDRAQVVDWLSGPGYVASGWARRPLTREQAEAFVTAGWAPTFVAFAGGPCVEGVEMCAAPRGEVQS
jgi:hypothetical protein